MVRSNICMLLSILIPVLGIYPRVKLEQGTLEGRILVTDDGKEFYAFSAIPYATPPIGDLRFQAPQPPEPWEGILDAKQEKNICKQFYQADAPTGDEDCLFVNVYTPKVDAKLPVMVFIHGGGLQAESNTIVISGPDWIIEEDIVMVAVNYRLGVMGFLSLDIPEAPGNAGLKDQIAALYWVKKNIKQFGGDPDNITIFGASGGGASVGYLLVSDVPKRLFHKAITMSGSPLNPWARVENAKEYALGLCRAFGHSPVDEFDALQFLKTVSADEIYQTIGKVPPTTVVADENMALQKFIFAPIIEKNFPGQQSPIWNETFLHRIVYGKYHQVPFIVGHVEMEGILALDIEKNPVLNGLVNANFERYIPKEMCLQDGSNKSLTTASKIKEYYYQNQTVDETSFKSFVNVKGDTWFTIGIDKMARLVAEHSSAPVFYYLFSFSEFSILYNIPSLKRAGHYDDLPYIVTSKTEPLPRKIASIELTRKRMIKMFTNFAKTGHPTPLVSDILPLKWEPISADKVNCLNISKDLRMTDNPNKKRIEFWDTLMKDYNECNASTLTSYNYNKVIETVLANAGRSIHISNKLTMLRVHKLILYIFICIIFLQ